MRDPPRGVLSCWACNDTAHKSVRDRGDIHLIGDNRLLLAVEAGNQYATVVVAFARFQRLHQQFVGRLDCLWITVSDQVYHHLACFVVHFSPLRLDSGVVFIRIEEGNNTLALGVIKSDQALAFDLYQPQGHAKAGTAQEVGLTLLNQFDDLLQFDL